MMTSNNIMIQIINGKTSVDIVGASGHMDIIVAIPNHIDMKVKEIQTPPLVTLIKTKKKKKTNLHKSIVFN